jgi:Fur family transcriptional regulator, ferric uptake regulator
MMQSEQWFKSLQDSGYRLTGPRRAVVKIMSESEYILGPNQIFTEARKLYPDIGLVTVYRTLEKLEELGLVTRVHEIQGCHAYVSAPVGHQHLLLCRACNRVEYFMGEDIEPLNQLGIEKGYDIQDHWLQLFGICPQCQPRKA